MLTMRPQRALTITGAAARAIRYVPLTLVTMISRQTSGSASQNFNDLVFGEASSRAGPLPALLTSTCSAPKDWSVSVTTRSQWDLLVMSPTIAMTLPAPGAPATAAVARASADP